jgi:hypothetical protein
LVGDAPLANVVDWLLEGEPFVEYRVRVDLLGQPENAPDVLFARKKMVLDPKIKLLIQDLKDWQNVVLNSHKSAGHPIHKLAFIADLGLKKDDPQVEVVIAKIFEHQSAEGPFQVPVNISKHFGGSGINEWGWALCDAPLVVYSLAKLGLEKDVQVQKAAKYLAGLAFENGWHCTVSKELGKFHGPGRKDDPCPYANLAILKMLSQFEEWKSSPQIHVAAECLLNLWQKSLQLHPYMFYMGTDFRKLKAPFVWYDILHVLDVLSHFDWLKDDPRLREMFELVKSKADTEGKFTPQSEWKAWNGWEFGQKKQPSRWLTFLVLRIQRRIEK